MKVFTGGIYNIIVGATLIVGTAAATATSTVATAAKDDSNNNNNNNNVRRHRRAGGLRRTAVLLKIDSEESKSESSSSLSSFSSNSSSNTKINKKQQEKVDSVADRILEETNIMQIMASTKASSSTTTATSATRTRTNNNNSNKHTANANANVNRNLLQAGWLREANHQSIAQETNAFYDATDMANLIRNNEFSMSMETVSFFSFLQSVQNVLKTTMSIRDDKTKEGGRKEGVYSFVLVSYYSFYIRQFFVF